MDHGNPADSAHAVPPVPEPATAADHGDGAQRGPLAFQEAYLLEQLADGGAKTPGDLNKKLSKLVERALHLTKDTANKLRLELVAKGYLSTTKSGRKVSFSLTEAGRTYLDGLERPVLGERRKVQDDASVTDEVRDGQKAYLLLQLLDADCPLTRSEANKIRTAVAVRLGLKPAVANHRRQQLAEQKYLEITREGRSERYALTRDGLDYLAAGARHYEGLELTIKGKTLNSLVGAARESSFERAPPSLPETTRPMPTPPELEQAVESEFHELLLERHGRSGLVPIHEVRRRLVDRFGPAAGRHDVLDDIILGLWRAKKLGLQAISDLNDANEQQLSDSIKGVHGTLFYLEAPREHSAAFEPVQR